MQVKQTHSLSMEKPLISFIVTYYNLPLEMLCECIESILSLSLRPYEREIIIVDDGSNSCPMNALMKYGSDILYLRKSNGGVSTARNLGLRTASGQYIQFIDADDRLLQPAYEHCIDLIRFSKTDMVMFDFTSQKETEADFTDQGPLSGTDLMRSQNIHGSICSYLFQQSIRGTLLFTPGTNYGEDEEFTAQLILRAESTYRTNATAYYYRQHQASATHQTSKRSIIRRLSETKAVITRLNAFTDRLPVNEKTALQRRVAQLTMDYLYNIIRLTGSRHYLERKMEGLRQEGLFPLPDKDYTTKYTWFRRLSNSPMGISLLMRLIPLIQKEA